MGELLIKPYEISVWEDKLTQDGFQEVKLAVIGSNLMTGPNKVYEPIFTKRANGEKTLSFSLKYKYFDPYSGNEEVVNPFAALLINERKVKLHYDNQWYEFIIKDHTESSDELTWTYTCTDAFVLELSKQGYNITFDAELNNNQGTAKELATKTLKDTDWQVGSVNNFKQFIEEPVYSGILENPSVVDIKNTDIDMITTEFDAGAQVYVFYSYIKNQNGNFVQFIIKDDNKQYTIDSKNVVTDTNYRIISNLIYKNNGFYLASDETILVLSLDQIETRFHVNRLAYGQLTIYDPVMDRIVERFKLDDYEVYKYTDYTYTTSDIVMNYFTNGDNFNALEDGSLQGWNPYVDFTALEEDDKITKLELVTRPELGIDKNLVDISKLSQVEGFLKVNFKNKLIVDEGQAYNLIYNSGIENNASFIRSLVAGEEYLFRWRAGTGDLDSLLPTKKLGLMIAKYSRDEATRYGYYYRHIDTNDIILQIENLNSDDLSSDILNNEITGGHIENGNYIIDDIAQSLSTKYIYVDNDIRYAWDAESGEFIPLEQVSNFLPYYYAKGTIQRSISQKDLVDPEDKKKVGLFIYTIEEGGGDYYIQDIELLKYILDGEGNPVLEGNVPVATSNSNDYYYFKPDSNTDSADVILYLTPESLKDSIGSESELVALYNENSEKNLSISISQSNCFNILQTIAETFECWVDLVVDHDNEGRIIKTEGKPNKFVFLNEYAGKDNWAGFKYAINLESIERNINSDEIVTKLIVDQSQSDYTDEGFVSISNAASNPSGESFILNFDYYYNQGLLDREQTEKDIDTFTNQVASINKDIQTAEKQRRDLEASYTTISSKRNVLTELVNAATEAKNEGLADFEELTGYTYEEYQSKHQALIDGEEFFEDFIISAEEHSDKILVLSQDPIKYSTIIVDVLQFDATYEFTSFEPQIINIDSSGLNTISYDGYKTFTFVYSEETLPIIAEIDRVDVTIACIISSTEQLTKEETVLDTIGKLYASSATINNYSGILQNLEKQYWELKNNLYGYLNYKVKIYVNIDKLEQRHVIIEFNDYLNGIHFTLGNNEYITTLSKKYFDILTNDQTLIFTAFPQNYTINLVDNTYIINDNQVANFKITTTNTKEGIVDQIDELIESKNQYITNFNNKYSRFIQEGTWNSTNYIESELYYLDALQVSNTSAFPIVSYTINVVEISQLDGYEWYLFDAGDKTYIEDTEFFGWANRNGVLTPAREEVIVSEVEWHLDEPDQNIITVQNYKTRFEDFFQRINAAVQTVQYNEATYAKISSLLDTNGTINQDVLLASLNRISGQQYNLTSDGSVLINGDNILIRNLTNAANLVKINSEGIRISADGGNTWATAIDGRGINIGTVYTGTLNTDNVVIGNANSPSFRWDKSGISAYRSTEETSIIDGETIQVYDLQTYVRYDEYGLYGIKNNSKFKAESLEEIKDNAHFAVTWDGFFIKNAYTGGGKVQITSENDFQVINSDQTEKIKIGALEWTQDGVTTTTPIPGVAPSLYGIRINNNAGDTVFKTGDDGNLEITGTIIANAGEIGGMSVDNDRLRMDHIVFEPGTGIYSDWGETSVYPFIISDKDGSATFNNVIVRGSIKTSVFEYEEIQAVGGAFMFRPSTAIKTVTEDNGDLVLTVEKPLILRDGAWYKLSNYNSDNTIDADELTTYGLTHIYQLSKIKVEDETEIRLIGGAAILQTINIDDIPGGSIIDMGFEPNTYRPMKLIAESSPVALHLYELVNNEYVLTADTEVVSGKTYYKEWYQVGINNYGIGINSSDNYINLPPRAISLFETIVDHTQDPKVSYKYRGILGTLPQMRYSGNNPQVSELYHNYLEGTQGIYTDNMYLGDKEQYIAFYEDSNGNKQLKIKANQVMYEIVDEETGESEWKDVQDTSQGLDGEDAITVSIDSSAGNVFLNKHIQTTLTCTVTKGNGTDITNQVTRFTWTKKNADGTIDSSWSRPLAGRSITLTDADVNSKAVFVCEVEF